MKIAVLGSGGWGTALSLLLAENGHEPVLWSYSAEESETLHRTHTNPLLPGVSIPPAIQFTSDLSCVSEAEAVVMATPSFATRETARKMKGHIRPNTLVVSVSKGIEKETSLTLTEVISSELGFKDSIAALSGPSHAEEVGRGVLTCVVAAGEKKEIAEKVQDIFMNPRFRVYTSQDIIGVELGAALKNIIALAAGICDGLGYGDNTKAALMTRGLAEIARLGEAKGAKKETFAGLAGLGDMIVTCTSVHSRNRRCGIAVGKGVPPQQAVSDVGMVVEGYYACDNARILAEKLGVQMPITEAVYGVMYRGKDPRDAVRELMLREKKSEDMLSWVN